MESRVVLITGCSTGIGRNLAERLARAGYTVVATARNVESLRELPVALKLPLDVTSQTSVDQAVLDTLREFGRIDVLVNNAGHSVRAVVEEVDEALARAMFDVNVWGLLRVTKAVLPHMRANCTGRVIHVGSVMGKFTFPVNGAYAASKHAVEAIADAMRVELKGFGIPVVVIEPGTIDTNFLATSESRGVAFSSNADSPYAPIYAQFRRMASTRKGANAERVSSVIQHAIEARRPRARYLAAVSPLYRLMLLLGDRVRDLLEQRAFRIRSRSNSTAPATGPSTRRTRTSGRDL
jgi:NADP-dependent 3-hydroxy acid dehydrogenase YdfG